MHNEYLSISRRISLEFGSPWLGVGEDDMEERAATRRRSIRVTNVASITRTLARIGRSERDMTSMNRALFNIRPAEVNFIFR